MENEIKNNQCKEITTLLAHEKESRSQMYKRDETSYPRYSFSHRYINIIYRTSNLSLERKKKANILNKDNLMRVQCT